MLQRNLLTLQQFSGHDELPHERTTPEFGLFYAMQEPYRGRGYTTEAAQAIINYIFERIGAGRVVATTTHDNLASQRVMEKLGMMLYKNSGDTPHWFQVVGVLNHPQAR